MYSLTNDIIDPFIILEPKKITMKRRYMSYFIVVAIAGSLLSLYFYIYQVNRPTFGLQVDPTKDITDISGIQYRVRLTNVGIKQLTGIAVDLGKNDIQHLSFLDPGQSYYFYPKPDTVVGTVKVITNEGVNIQTDYRSPAKVLGLPGAGR